MELTGSADAVAFATAPGLDSVTQATLPFSIALAPVTQTLDTESAPVLPVATDALGSTLGSVVGVVAPVTQLAATVDTMTAAVARPAITSATPSAPEASAAIPTVTVAPDAAIASSSASGEPAVAPRSAREAPPVANSRPAARRQRSG